MRVFDCFTFYNEFDILELRLQELWDTVDFFVIAEGNLTHQSNPKPFYLKDNWERFEKYSSKIRHIMLDDMPGDPNTWVNENFQRRELRRGLTDLQPDDLVIVSDCDEIPRPEAIELIKEDTNGYSRYVLGIPLFYFKLNFLMVQPHSRQRNIIVTRASEFTDAQREREFTFNRSNLPIVDTNTNSVIIDHGGWHWTYFGHNDFAANKLKNFAHAESKGLADTVDVDYMIANKVGFLGFNYVERFEYVEVDDYFPRVIVENLEKYQDMIVPNATHSVYDFYPE